MSQVFSSVRNRLMFWFAGSLVLALMALSLIVYLLVSSWMREELDRGLERDLSQFALRLASASTPQEALPPDFGSTMVAVWLDGKRLASTEPWSHAGLDGAVLNSARDQFMHRPPEGPVYCVRRGFVSSGHMIAAARDATGFELARERLFLVLALSLVAVMIAGLAVSWFFASAITRPLRRLAAQSRTIGPQDLSRRLHAENPDEIGVVADAFNATLDRLQGAFREMRRFTSDASHQLRTPLTAMRTIGESALSSDTDADRLRDTVGQLLEEAENLNRLVDTLLLLTRGEAGESRVRLARVDVGELTKEVAGTLEVLAQEKEQTVEINVADGLFANADAELLRQAVMNVFDNAIRYTPVGGSIRLECGRNDGLVRIAVEDSGPGIPDADRERIFERFYRSEAAARTVREGSGLGLAVARWCVESCGGTIRAESAAGGGARFTVQLPLA